MGKLKEAQFSQHIKVKLRSKSSKNREDHLIGVALRLLLGALAVEGRKAILALLVMI